MFLTKAVHYDTVKSEIVGTITAKVADPENYPSEQNHFYCPSCYDDGHFTRLKRVPKISVPFTAPDRFNLLNRKNSTHQCTLPVRYRELDCLAKRYNAETIGKHSYIFTLSRVLDIPENLRTVDRASRLAKITYALMYDPKLRSKQFLKFNDENIPFNDAMYGDLGKIRLYKDSLKAAQVKSDFYGATIFRPLGNRKQWEGFKDHFAIPGIAGPSVTYDGEKLRPSAVLLCKSQDRYYKIKKLADRNGYNKSSPLIVFGRAVLSLDNMKHRVQRIRSGFSESRAAHTCFVINDINQVALWDHHVSFNKAISDQKNSSLIQDNGPLFAYNY